MASGKEEEKMGEEFKKLQHMPEFQKLMEERMIMGAKKYGDNDWKFGDNMADLVEELVDAANYLYFFFSRLRWVDEHGEPPYYLNPCRCKEISNLSKGETELLVSVFNEYKVCYRLNHREYHFCLNVAGEEQVNLYSRDDNT